MKKYLIVFIFISVLIFNLSAQSGSEYDELRAAFVNIQNKKYKEAYPYFAKMLQLYPKDPTYQYNIGICLLHLESDPKKSISYLRSAATKDVPLDVYYYLGVAYLRNYQFEKSLESFQWFEKNANKKTLRESDYRNYKSMAQNGLFLTKYIQKPTVYSKVEYSKDQFYQNYTFDGLEGYFISSNDYFEEPEDSLKDTPVMFVPNGLKKELYFSKRNEKRGDYDIYKIEQLSDTSWSKPQNLGNIINTPFDENYPFLHFDGTTLYFASKGHYSMGGYDLYKSIWNWNEQKWTEPENLDFPINSPYDDILFVSSPNKRDAMFASNRDTDSSTLNIYHIKWSSSDPYTEINSHQEILEFARLDVNAKFQKASEKVSTPQYIEGKKELVKIKNDEGILQLSKYDSLLNQAINFQLKADSIRWIIDEKRNAFGITKDGQLRARLSNTIVELEREIYALQRNADGCYAQVREIEQLNLASKKTIYEENQKTDKKPTHNQYDKKRDNFFVEPTPDSINIQRLVIVIDTLIEDSIIYKNFGLRLEKTSYYNSNNPIPNNEILPDGIIYMIQLGAFSSDKLPEIFKGLTPLSCIKSENSDIRKYFAGKFFQLAEAEKNLNTVKSKCFKDAYVVAFNNGKIVSVKTALKLESDTESNKIINSDNEIHEEISTDQPEIIFVVKGQFNMNDTSIIDSVRTFLTNNLELYIQSRYSTFLIKSFSTFDAALPLKRKLDAILPKEVEIHAYFAENQIPLEQARKIVK